MDTYRDSTRRGGAVGPGVLQGPGYFNPKIIYSSVLISYSLHFSFRTRSDLPSHNYFIFIWVEYSNITN